MSLSQSTATVYQQRAAATRARRQAAGKYAKPSAAQVAAFKKSLQRGGNSLLTVEEMLLLAEHPYLARSQRELYAAQACLSAPSLRRGVNFEDDALAEAEYGFAALTTGLENPCSYEDYVAPDGTLQRIIDEGEQTAELEDWLIDVEWMRGGM